MSAAMSAPAGCGPSPWRPEAQIRQNLHCQRINPRHRIEAVFLPAPCWSTRGALERRRDDVACAAATAKPAASGHTALLHDLGALGDVPAQYMPWLLRIAHVRSKQVGGDSKQQLEVSARGFLVWQVSLNKGLVADDATLRQLMLESDGPFIDYTFDQLRWPEEPLRSALIRTFSKLGAATFAKKYPAVKQALLLSVLQALCKYVKTVLRDGEEEEEEEERAVDSDGIRAMTVAELMQQEIRQRRVRAGLPPEDPASPSTSDAAAENSTGGGGVSPTLAERPLEQEVAEKIAEALQAQWEVPMATLEKAGRAFDGLEALLGGEMFSLADAVWRRKGWLLLDGLRKKLEDVRELRDLVRSLGRGGGWGPLRRSPIQYLDMKGRPGLLRTVLEAQETRGLTRSDDISRLLPSEAVLLSRGRTSRQAKLLFFSKLAEKSLQTYERDGWAEFPTNIVQERREVRPTADRGPILLCLDTSGSMRGPREVVAKALALECMRSAREQQRDCYVFAFSGPQEVEELELNNDVRSVNNLLTFLERVFNGGSDFNEPVRRCLERLSDAKWANADILMVSDGELRQPAPEVMRKLAGAKQKLGLRVHGLVVGEPHKQRADPAVFRSLCTNPLPNGTTQTLVSSFQDWEGVKRAGSGMQFDWDDIEGNTRRRLAGLKLEAHRKKQQKRLRKENGPTRRASKRSANKTSAGRAPKP